MAGQNKAQTGPAGLSCEHFPDNPRSPSASPSPSVLQRCLPKEFETPGRRACALRAGHVLLTRADTSPSAVVHGSPGGARVQITWSGRDQMERRRAMGRVEARGPSSESPEGFPQRRQGPQGWPIPAPDGGRGRLIRERILRGLWEAFGPQFLEARWVVAPFRKGVGTGGAAKQRKSRLERFARDQGPGRQVCLLARSLRGLTQADII